MQSYKLHLWHLHETLSKLLGCIACWNIDSNISTIDNSCLSRLNIPASGSAISIARHDQSERFDCVISFLARSSFEWCFAKNRDYCQVVGDMVRDQRDISGGCALFWWWWTWLELERGSPRWERGHSGQSCNWSKFIQTGCWSALLWCVQFVTRNSFQLANCFVLQLKRRYSAVKCSAFTTNTIAHCWSNYVVNIRASTRTFNSVKYDNVN